MVGVRGLINTRSNTGQPDFELAPDPGTRTFIVPPCSRTMSRVIASPNPLPVARVVKNGSKIRPRAISSMPLPVSLTTTRTPTTRSKHAVAELARGRYVHRLNFQLDTPGVTHRLRGVVAQFSSTCEVARGHRK